MSSGRGMQRWYLLAALCIAVATIMLAPIVLSFLASIKSPDEASAVPPTTTVPPARTSTPVSSASA